MTFEALLIERRKTHIEEYETLLVEKSKIEERTENSNQRKMSDSEQQELNNINTKITSKCAVIAELNEICKIKFG